MPAPDPKITELKLVQPDGGFTDGDTMTLTVKDNLAKADTIRIYDLRDSNNVPWVEQDRVDAQTAKFSARAPDRSGSVSVTMTRKFDSKSASGSVSYTSKPVDDGEPSTDTKRGTTFNHPVGPSKVGAARIYDANDDQPLRDAVAHGVTRISLSSKDDTSNPATVISRIKSVFSRYPQIDEIDYAHENEADRSDHSGGSESSMNTWADECKAIFASIKAETNWGSGKSVKTAVDMTRWGTRKGVSQKMMQKLKDRGALPEIYGSSMYGPGRDDNPATKDAPETHLGMCIDVAVQFGIKLVSCYEIACPLSSNYDRPSYVASWFPWAVKYAESKGVKIRDFDYWNGAKSGSFDNRFSADGSTSSTVGKTEKAFFA